MVLTFEGCNFFGQRVILATLSGKTMKIKNIRSAESNPGLKNYEIGLVRLIEKITNGSRFQISETGTSLYYQPGTLYGGKVEHDCDLGRGISYYLQVLMAFAPFARDPIEATLNGATNTLDDPSVDRVRYAQLPVLAKYMGFDEGLDIKVNKRGVLPGGGGQVVFTSPVRTKLRTHQWTKLARVKRVRGMSWAVRVAPTQANRLVEAARGVLNSVVHDIYITTDHRKGAAGGKSPGYGVTLVAETTDGQFLCGEAMSHPQGADTLNVPEDIGREAALNLLREVYAGGCVECSGQSLSCLMMVLGPNDVSKLILGDLTPYTIQFLRHIEEFFGIVFKVDNYGGGEKESQKVALTCVGVGYSNLNKLTL